MEGTTNKKELAQKRPREEVSAENKGAATVSPLPQQHPIDPVLAHIQPPLEPASLQQLTQEVKDRITKAAIDESRRFRRANEGKDKKSIAYLMKPALRKCFLLALNGAVDGEMRSSLDVSVHNHAVKLLLSHFDEFQDEGEMWALVAKKLKEEPFSPLTSTETCKALAKALLETVPFQQAQCLLPLLKQEKTVKLSPAQQLTLVGISSEIDGLFKKNSVDIPWDGDAALGKLTGRSQTIVDLIRGNYTLFSSEALEKVFGKKVMICEEGTIEFQVRIRNAGGAGHIENHQHLISKEKNARFRGPPHDVIVVKNLPTLLKDVLTALIGASGAGKTMAALLTGIKASDCVLYFKASTVFSKGVNGENETSRNKRVTDDIQAALTKALGGHAGYLAKCHCSPPLEGAPMPRCQCPSLSVTIVIDEAGAYVNELRGLCAVYKELCGSITTRLQAGVHILVVGTGVDATAELGSESHRYQVVPIKTRLWDDFSAALLNNVTAETAQLRRAIEIINEVTNDPYIVLARTLLDNARCAAIFARHLQESNADATEEHRASDETLRLGLFYIATNTVLEFMNINGLKKADRTGAIHRVLVWTMNAWQRAAIQDAYWQVSSTNYGIAVSAAISCEKLPTDVVALLQKTQEQEVSSLPPVATHHSSKLLPAAKARMAVYSLVQKEGSAQGDGKWVKGYIAGALLYQYQPQRRPYTHIEPAFVSMLLLMLEHIVARSRTYVDLELRTADMAGLCCRVPAVDDSGSDPNVAVEALTPFRRIVNHMHVPLKNLVEERAQKHNRVLQTDAGKLASTFIFETKKWSCEYQLQPGCFKDDKKGQARMKKLKEMLKSFILVLVNAAQAAYADVIALGSAKLVLFQCKFTQTVTMKMVLEEFAKMTPLAVGCTKELLRVYQPDWEISHHATNPDVPLVGPNADITAGRQALTEQLIGIGSGWGGISGWTCTPVVDAGPTVDQTATADFVVDSVLVHESSKGPASKPFEGIEEILKPAATFAPADPTRLVGTFYHPLLGGAWQQTVVYTSPAASSGERPLRVTYRYFFLEMTPDLEDQSIPRPFYPLM